MSGAALVFVLIFSVLLSIPCIGVGWLGKRMLDRLGRYPSKTPAIQMSIMVRLIVIEIVSLTLILSFFKILVSE